MDVEKFLEKYSDLEKYFSDRENNKLKNIPYNGRIMRLLLNNDTDLLIQFISLEKMNLNIIIEENITFALKTGKYFIEKITDTEILKKVISLGADPKNLQLKGLLIYGKKEMKELFFQLDIVNYIIYIDICKQLFSDMKMFHDFIEISSSFGIKKFWFFSESQKNINENKIEKIEKIKLPDDIINDIKVFIILK